MSTLKTVNIQHPSSASVNAGTDTSGNFLINSGYGSVATAYGCRAWINFDGTTASPTIRASGNVTSITDNGVGDYTVNFTTVMPDTNFATVANMYIPTNTSGWVISTKSVSTSSVQIQSNPYAGTTKFDSTEVSVAIFR